MVLVQRLGVAVHELGGVQGPPLLLLHANGFHGRVFLPMIPFLAPHFRCVALDLPGHGSAPSPSKPFTSEDFLSAVREYVDTHGITDCYCFGHSLGGSMAALLQQERPQTFKAMFLYEPVIRPFQELRQEDGMQMPRNRAAGAGPTGGGGCGPSPSLQSATSPTAQSESVLARIARKRQAVFPSLEAAKASLGAKPPFNTWQPEALHAYLACGGLRPLDGSGLASNPDPNPAIREAALPPSVAFEAGNGGLGSSSDANACIDSRGAAASSPLTLSCTPENEARVYEALDPPPWRPWQELTTGSGADLLVDCGPDSMSRTAAANVRQFYVDDSQAIRTSSMRTSGVSSIRSRLVEELERPVGRRACRLAIAVGREVGLHARLARWGVQLSELVPGAKLIRFDSLHHLGPMEDPQAVALAALEFFAAADMHILSRM